MHQVPLSPTSTPSSSPTSSSGLSEGEGSSGGGDNMTAIAIGATFGILFICIGACALWWFFTRARRAKGIAEAENIRKHQQVVITSTTNSAGANFGMVRALSPYSTDLIDPEGTGYVTTA